MARTEGPGFNRAVKARQGNSALAAQGLLPAILRCGLVFTGLSSLCIHLPAQRIKTPSQLPQCRRAVIEGTVQAGQGFQQQFTTGLVFGLEPIASGWAVRVVPAGRPREPHDYAEVATLPYQSVSPLLLSTDWSFRAQDAVGWTPRRFRYAANEPAFIALAAVYDSVLRGDATASQKARLLAQEQPEAVLEIRDATLAPGSADQTRTATAVSARFNSTPHTLDMHAKPSSLGRLEEVRFRVLLDLRQGVMPAKGTKITNTACPARPTVRETLASESHSTQISR